MRRLPNDSGIVELQEEKVMDMDELVKLCTRTEVSCPGFKKFDFFEIVDGTDHFSTKRIVGRGGFGTVYKVLINRNIVLIALNKSRDITFQNKKNRNIVRCTNEQCMSNCPPPPGTN
jgi:hypothetical protein